MPLRDMAPVAVFDLDGTVLDINSFPHWVMFLIAGHLPEIGLHRRLLLSLRVALRVLQRKLLGTSHEALLRHLQAAWRSAIRQRPHASLHRFEAMLLQRVRPNLGRVLQLVATGQIDAVLATAAAEDYAAGLGRQLGFRHVLATGSDRRHDDPANSGVHKRGQVLAFLVAHGWNARPIILFTDHLDDLPLMRDSSTVYWCGPPDTMPQAVAAAAGVSFIRCNELPGTALAEQFSNTCQPDVLRLSAVS
jgi:phosphoserine phosphatase